MNQPQSKVTHRSPTAMDSFQSATRHGSLADRIVDSLREAMPPTSGPEGPRCWLDALNDVESGKWNGTVDLAALKDWLISALSSCMTDGQVNQNFQPLLRSGKIDLLQARAMTFERNINEQIRDAACARSLPDNFHLAIDVARHFSASGMPDNSVVVSADLTQELGNRDYTGTCLDQFGIKRHDGGNGAAYKELAHLDMGAFLFVRRDRAADWKTE